MNTTAITPTQPVKTRSLPSTLQVGLARGSHELRCFFRSKEVVVFTLAFPVMFLVLFGAIFGNEEVLKGVKYSRFFSPESWPLGLPA